MLSSLHPNEACANPTGARIEDIGNGGSISPSYLSLNGFYCLNDEQPGGKICSDFAGSYCCPVEKAMDCE